MNLATIASTKKLTAKVEFQDGIIVELLYVPKARLQQLAKECTTHRWNPEAGARLPEMDAKKLGSRFAGEVVLGWEGLTVRNASKLVQLETTGVNLDEAVPFEPDNLKHLVTNSQDFDIFLQRTAMDLSVFSGNHKEEVGNSEPSQSGN